MALAFDLSFFIIFLGIVITIVTIIVTASTKNTKQKTRFQSTGHSTYVPGQYSRQMEFDMRLPYKRFKQLYPHNPWTYEEFKQMQKQTAFRRSTSSMENKRMIR